MQEFQIGDRQYYANATIKHFVVPDGCSRIGAGAFAFSGLESIRIAPSVREIGFYAFSGLCFMEKIVIPEGVVAIGDMAFSGCIRLRRVVLPKSLVRVGRGLFYGCVLRVQVAIPREICAHVPLKEWSKTVEIQFLEENPSAETEPESSQECGSITEMPETNPAPVAPAAPESRKEETPIKPARVNTVPEEKPQKIEVEYDASATIAECARIYNAESEWAEKPIEDLKLSGRVYNALKRGRIDTVGRLLSRRVEELTQIGNMGRASLKEIIDRLVEAEKNDQPTKNQASLSELRLLVDQPIEELALSVRPCNALNRNQIITVNALAGMNREQLAKIPYMGVRSVNEVCERLSAYLSAAQARGETCAEEKQTAVEAALPAFLGEAVDTVCGLFPELPRETVKLQAIRVWKTLEMPESMDAAAFVEAVWQADFFAQQMRIKLKRLLNLHKFDGISEREMGAALSDGLPDQRLRAALNELEAAGELRRKGDFCFPVLQTLDDYLSQIPDERLRFCLSGKLQGETLESMAQTLGITRERVRQIVNKGVRNDLPGRLCLNEDRYAALYQKYALEPTEFRVIFRERVQTWNYLSLRYQQGDLPLKRAVDDASLPREQRIRIRDYLEEANSDYLTVNDQRIPLNRTALIDFVVRNFCRDTVDVNAFAELYNQFLRTNGVENERLYITEDTRRYIETRLPENRHLLWSLNRHLRFYDIDAGDYSELLETLDLGAYHDIEISTRKFMLDYPQLMRRYDIRDEYELHNLLKKIGAERENDTLSFSRMPMLSFGNVDRGVFMREALMECAPCDRDTLIRVVSERNGVLPETVGATWLAYVDSYYYAGMYTVDSPEMPEAEEARLRAALTEDAYTLEEIAHLYRRAGGTNEKLITPYNLKRLGFLVFSRLAVRNARNARDYFSRKLTESDVVDYSEMVRRFGLLSTFTTVLNALKDSYEIIEFEPHQLIQLRKLQSFGIDRPQLHAFCDAVAECVSPGALFSMKLLHERGMEFELDALGFEETFYNSLLREDERFDFCRMGGKMVFRRREPGDAPRPLNRTDLAICLLRDRESMDVDDMAEEIRRDFGVEVDRYDLKTACEQAGFYWDSIMNRVYRSYEIYYDEV